MRRCGTCCCKRLISCSLTFRRSCSTNADDPSPSVQFLLDKIRARDKLPFPDPHIEHLVSGNSGPSSNSNSANGSVDFSDKTRLILQSSHPIRHVIEREILNLQNQSQFVSYHNWVTLFGRSLDANISISNPNEAKLFETNLNHISNAAEVGMLSSKVHETVLDIPPTVSTKELGKMEQFHMGNKYAVLVGDYFAVKTVYYTQKTKVNKVFLCITRGIEDFASVSFFSRLGHPGQCWYPIVAASGTTAHDWSNYAAKVSGYFSGALHAVLTITKNDLHSSREFTKTMKEFCRNICQFLQIVNELENLKTISDPQVCVTLPAIIYQQQYPQSFDRIREKSVLVADDDFRTIQEELLNNAIVMEQVFQKISEHACKTKELIKVIGVDSYYVKMFQDLIDATTRNAIR